MGTLQIDILGTSFTIKADEDSEYLSRLLGYYKRIAGEIENGGALKDPLQISVLAGIMLCDELYKEKSKSIRAGSARQRTAESDDEAERVTQRLIEKIDRALN